MSTYKMIKSLPAKGFDWTSLNTALRAKVLESYGTKSDSLVRSGTLAEWDAAKGIRAVRGAAMEMANFYVSNVARRQNIIAPSSESRMWDSFEGGHNDVWQDADATVAATQEIADLIEQVRR
jgi:hypothetical protein